MRALVRGPRTRCADPGGRGQIGLGRTTLGSAHSGDCGSLSKQAGRDASAVGTGIGIATIIVIWVVVDFLVAAPT